MHKIVLAFALAVFVLYDVSTADSSTVRIERSVLQPSPKADRIEPSCSLSAWLSYNANCALNQALAADHLQQVHEV